MVVAIYARVSPTQKKSVKDGKVIVAASIKQQLIKCRKQVEVDDEIILKEYCDEYISGKAKEDMKAFTCMMEDARDAKFNKIYCLRIDRFGRNFFDLVNAHHELTKLNIHLKFVEQGFDTGDKFGKMIMRIMASIAEWQRETILDNITRGRVKAYKENPEKFGRPNVKIDWDIVKPLLDQEIDNAKPKHSWSSIARKMGVSTSTLIRRYKKKYGNIPTRRI